MVVMLQRQKQQQQQQQQRQITIVLVLVVELMLMTNNVVSCTELLKPATTNATLENAAANLNKTINETNLNRTQEPQQQQQQQQVVQHLLPVLGTKNDQNIFKYESIGNVENVAVTNVTASNENQRNFTKITQDVDENRNENLANHFNSSEILLESDDVAQNGSILPTTYRPSSPTRSAQASAQAAAQDRERKLMNLLAARRSALHRTGVRQRIGTTSRTAIETTSKSPTDPRSICIRNCTKNFTRRTTASCMRQCANFSRTPSIPNTPNNTTATAVSTNQTAAAPANGTATTSVVFRPTTPATQRKLAEKLNPDRDTNEILFSDESSHGVFVVAKEQNDTLNHITELVKPVGATKLRQRGKPASQQSTVASTSIEDDDLQPYLYFGQKLPPIKPALLTITSVSDDHPKLLEVSLAQLATTTPATPKPTPTLSAVERSRARFKYYMRDRGTSTAFARRNSATARPLPSTEQSVDLKPAAVVPASTTTSTTSTTSSTTPSSITSASVKKQKVEYLTAKRLKDALEIRETIREAVAFQKALAEAELKAAEAPASSTPLIITVLSDDLPEEEVQVQKNEPMPMTPITTSTPIPTPTPSTTVAPTTIRSTRVTSTTPRATESTPPLTKAPTTTTTITTTTTTTTTPKLPPKNTISDSETELLRALGPSLTQPIATDEKTNLIIFYNRTRGSGSSTTTSTIRPTTDNSFNIIRTTVLTSVRSTVNPQQSAVPSANGESQPPVIVGIVESASSSPVGGGSTTTTVESNENKISAEKRRMNIVTMVLAGIGFVPLLAILLYVVRNFIARRHAKDDEDFDVCITDQQPISPVKKLDSNGKYNSAVEDEDEVDNHLQHIMSHHSAQHQQQSQHSNGTIHHSAPFKHVIRDVNYDRRYDEQESVTSSEQDFERRNIRLKSLLGEGNFGQVWKAEADNLSGHFGATRIVAVKTIRAHSAQKSLKDEATIMRKLGSHPNVVTLLGASVTSQPHMLIMEYAMRGRLLSLLRAARNATNILPASVPGGRSLAPLSPRTLAGFALDIACGMEYIAERRIVHRDLAARNVLLDHNGVCKICDFGMSIDLDAERKRKEQERNTANELMRHSVAAATQSKFKKFDFGSRFIMQHWHNSFGQNANQPHQQYKDNVNEKKGHGHGQGHDTISRRPALPIRWMAPEALQFNTFSTETDIWAFGIVLWEIATLGSTPYPQLSGREVIRRVPNGLRPELPKESNHEFFNLMARCWHKDPNMRPSFTQSRLEITRSLHKWVDDDSAASDYMDVSGFSEDLEHGVVYFNHRISEFECEI